MIGSSKIELYARTCNYVFVFQVSHVCTRKCTHKILQVLRIFKKKYIKNTTRVTCVSYFFCPLCVCEKT